MVFNTDSHMKGASHAHSCLFSNRLIEAKHDWSGTDRKPLKWFADHFQAAGDPNLKVGENKRLKGL
jgi:hypothetical protein